VDFAENMGFADTTGNQLGDLGTKVEDEDFLMHGKSVENSAEPSGRRSAVWNSFRLIPPGNWELLW
jgi:hypothetical protein